MSTFAQPKKTHAAIMNIRIALADDDFVSGDRMLEKLSGVLRSSAPAISRDGGRLTRVTEQGVTAIFENGSEAALKAAMDIFHSITNESRAGGQPSLSIGIHAGNVILSEFSYNGVTVPVTVSDGQHIPWKLCGAAARYNASILMTKTALDSVRSFDTRFNCRKLGIILLSRGGSEEVIYDMFDSDSTDLKYRKKRGRLVFETGVALYLRGEYLQSRNYFIELLKYDRSDKAAKEYVFKCDKALSGKPVAPQEKYLEIW